MGSHGCLPAKGMLVSMLSAWSVMCSLTSEVEGSSQICRVTRSGASRSKGSKSALEAVGGAASQPCCQAPEKQAGTRILGPAGAVGVVASAVPPDARYFSALDRRAVLIISGSMPRWRLSKSYCRYSALNSRP